MLRQTVDRLGDLVPNERRMVVTNERLVDAVREQLPELPAAAIVGEPCKRDTAPCIGLAALLVSRDDPDATMVVMPADHVIRPAEKFQAAIRQAAALVDAVAGADRDVWHQADVSGGDFWVHPSRRARSHSEPGRPGPAAAYVGQAVQGEAGRGDRPEVRRLGRILLELRHLRVAGGDDSRRAAEAAARDARPPGSDRRRLGHARTATPCSSASSPRSSRSRSTTP